MRLMVAVDVPNITELEAVKKEVSRCLVEAIKDEFQLYSGVDIKLVDMDKYQEAIGLLRQASRGMAHHYLGRSEAALDTAIQILEDYGPKVPEEIGQGIPDAGRFGVNARGEDYRRNKQ